MKLEKRSSGADQTPAAAPQETAPKSKKPVVVYIMILFIVAFLLIIIPTFLSPDTGGYAWSHVLSLLPPKIADFSFQSYTA